MEITHWELRWLLDGLALEQSRAHRALRYQVVGVTDCKLILFELTAYWGNMSQAMDCRPESLSSDPQELKTLLDDIIRVRIGSVV